MSKDRLEILAGGDGMPEEPDWARLYSDPADRTLAHKMWSEIVAEMHERQILSVANGNAIGRLIAFRVIYSKAAADVARRGAVVPAKRSDVPSWNPYFSLMKQADESCRMLEAELGLPPARRGRAVKVTRKARTHRASENYLRPIDGGKIRPIDSGKKD